MKKTQLKYTKHYQFIYIYRDLECNPQVPSLKFTNTVTHIVDINDKYVYRYSLRTLTKKTVICILCPIVSAVPVSAQT